MFVANALLIIFIAIVVKYCMSWRRLYQLGSDFPGPKAFPIVGNLFQDIRSDSKIKFQKQIKLFNKYGHIFRMWLGSRLIIFTDDSKVAELVLKNPKLLKRDFLFRTLNSFFVRKNVITSNGDGWKKHRKIVVSTLHVNILERFVDNFAKNSCILADRLAEVADGTIVDLYSYIGECALDIICETSMGTVVNAQLQFNGEFARKSTRCLELLGERSLRPWLLIDWLYKRTKLGKEHEEIAQYMFKFSKAITKKKLKEYETSGFSRGKEDLSDGKKMAFMDHVISNSLLSVEKLAEETNGLILAAYDTTTSACAYVLLLLGEYQDVQNKVFEEQKKIFGENLNRAVTNNDLQNMVYLEQVIKEGMRLYPPVPSTSRQLDCDVPLSDGRTIPAGSIVKINLFALHRNPEQFPDPERFDPERFSPENCSGRHPCAYLPFGAGRRMCVGYKYAMMEAKTILSTVLRRVRVTKAVGGMQAIDSTLQDNLVLKSTASFKVQLRTRRNEL